MTILASTDGQPNKKVATHWAHKLANRKSCRYAFLDSGATSGAAPEEGPQQHQQDVQENIHVPQWTDWKSNQVNAPQA
jgi:hypothetical protein